MKIVNRIIAITICTALILVSACQKLPSEKLPVASFTVSHYIAGIGDTIYFQNTSEGANTFDWDFGDGNSSTEENPSHIYTAESWFTILLVATNADGYDEANGSVWIKPWTTRTDMPTGRWDLSTCVVDGKIYAIGGASFYGSEALRTVEIYDPATDTWSTKSEMPTARQGLSTNVVNGKIYAIGGGVATYLGTYVEVEIFSTVEEYDPATDTWSTKSSMPSARFTHSANVVDGRIYVIGGSYSAPYLTSTFILTVEVYDPVTDTWTQNGDMPVGRAAGFTSVVDGKIYGFGGYGSRERVDEYDPVTDTWTKKADIPTFRVGLSTSVLDGKIYTFGGHIDVGNFPGVTTVEIYDPATDTWTTGPDMTTGRWGIRTSVVDGKIYAIGGLPLLRENAYGIVEVYYE